MKAKLGLGGDGTIFSDCTFVNMNSIEEMCPVTLTYLYVVCICLLIVILYRYIYIGV